MKRLLAFGVVASLLVPLHGIAASGVVRRVAGGGAGDGKPAMSVPLSVRYPMIASDGDLVFGDDNHRLRRIDIATSLITTIAGGPVDGRASWSTQGDVGDGGPATDARLIDPSSPVADNEGNIYFTDYRRIRRIDRATGVISTIAGSGERGFEGDGGPATDAVFGELHSMAMDARGNIYVTDPVNKRVRRIDSTGTIVTIAGNGDAHASGDGDLATSAGLGQPRNVAVDSAGNVYISGGASTHSVRKVDAQGRIWTVAGTGEAGYSGDGGKAIEARLNQPIGLAVDPDDNLLIADAFNGRIRRVDRRTGVITTIAGNGARGPSGDGLPAEQASFAGTLSGVAVAADGTIYVANGHLLRKIDARTRIVSTIAGNSTCCWSGDDVSALNATMLPHDVATDSRGRLYIADYGNARVRRVEPDGSLRTIAGDGRGEIDGDGGPALAAGLGFPTAIAIDPNDHIFVVSATNLSVTRGNVVRRIDADTGIITTYAGDGYRDPLSCGRYLGDGLPATMASLSCPTDLAFDTQGNLFIADSWNYRVRRVDAATKIITTVAGGPNGLADADGIPATLAYLRLPTGIAVDRSGNLYIAHTAGCRIRRVDATTGLISTIAGARRCADSDDDEVAQGDGRPAGEALFNDPTDVEVSAMGVIYVLDYSSNRIRAIDRDGVIRNVIGGWSRLERYSSIGDGGPAITAGVRFPSAMSVDAHGDLYFVDSINRRVRVVQWPHV